MIAFAHYSFRDDISGVTTWLEGLLMHLRQRGVPVGVFLRHLNWTYELTPLERRLRDADIPVECKPMPRFTGNGIRQVLRFLEHHQASVFLPQCLAEHMYTAQISGKAGLPWIFTHHSDDPLYWTLLNTTRPDQSNGRVVAVSGHIAGKCAGLPGGGSPVVIPYGVPGPAGAARFSSSPFRVVYSGRLVEEQKRVSLVIRTFVEVCRRDPRVECRVIGDGAELESCRQRVVEAGLSDRIGFTGRLDADGVRTELSAAQAILFMSDYEGLPLALLEAMTAGVVPVCRSIESGIPEVVHPRQTGLLVGPSPAEACSAVLELVNNETLWRHCSANAAGLIQRTFSHSACHDNWLELLRPYAGRPQGRRRLPARSWFSLPPYDKKLEGTYMRLGTAPRVYSQAILQHIRKLARPSK